MCLFLVGCAEVSEEGEVCCWRETRTVCEQRQHRQRHVKQTRWTGGALLVFLLFMWNYKTGVMYVFHSTVHSITKTFVWLGRVLHICAQVTQQTKDQYNSSYSCVIFKTVNYICPRGFDKENPAQGSQMSMALKINYSLCLCVSNYYYHNLVLMVKQQLGEIILLKSTRIEHKM